MLDQSFCGAVRVFPICSALAIMTCPFTISLKGRVVYTRGFILPLPVQYITSSSSALVPCVDPSQFVPLKNRYLKSIVDSYPVVAPVATSVPPIFKRAISCANVDLPMCSKITSTPCFFVLSLTFLYQSASL